MNQKSLYWGITIKVIWFMAIGIFAFVADIKLPKNLNELGDFLAGVFAPVAFLWLILGYVQQGKQLEQNTKALEQQETALQLQIEEMKESVKQQKAVTELERERLSEQQKLREAHFSIEQSKVRTTFGDAGMERNLYVAIYLTISNWGDDAFDFRITSLSRKEKMISIAKFASHQDQETKIELDEVNVELLNQAKEVDVEYRIEYKTRTGQVLSKLISIFIFQTKHPSYRVKAHISDDV